jgi:hypothetical protein
VQGGGDVAWWRWWPRSRVMTEENHSVWSRECEAGSSLVSHKGEGKRVSETFQQTSQMVLQNDFIFLSLSESGIYQTYIKFMYTKRTVNLKTEGRHIRFMHTSRQNPIVTDMWAKLNIYTTKYSSSSTMNPSLYIQ